MLPQKADDRGDVARHIAVEAKQIGNWEIAKVWAIPPCHGDQVGDVISTLEVVGVVRLEKSMVHTVVSFVRILKEGHRFVHHETMQGPFGKGGVTNTNEDKGQSAE